MAMLMSRSAAAAAGAAGRLRGSSGGALPLPLAAPVRARAAAGRRAALAVAAQAASAKAAAAAGPVRISIQGRRLPVTDAIRAYVEEKVAKAVHNYAANVRKVDVTLTARGGDTGTHGAKQQKVDVTITTLHSGVVRVEDAEDSLYASIDLVCDKVSRKLRRLKDRLIASGNWPGRAGPRVNSDEQDFKAYTEGLIVEIREYDELAARAGELAALGAEAGAAGAAAAAGAGAGAGAGAEAAGAVPEAVMRSKVVRLEPMRPGEAIDALEAVGHDFYVYRDAGSGGIQVVYRRDSGGYGILIPQ